jgi:predicted kinase
MPTLIFLSGLAGSGKSTTAKKLVEKFPKAVAYDKDKFLIPALGSQPYFGEYYKKIANPGAYKAMLYIASLAAAEGYMPILDAYNGDKLNGPLLKETLVRKELTIKVIHFHCCAETQYKRLEERGEERDKLDKMGDLFERYRIEHVEKHLRQLAQFPEHLIINSEESIEDCLKTIEEFINSPSNHQGFTTVDQKVLDQFTLSKEDAFKGAEFFVETLKTLRLKAVNSVVTQGETTTEREHKETLEKQRKVESRLESGIVTSAALKNDSTEPLAVTGKLFTPLSDATREPTLESLATLLSDLILEQAKKLDM